MTNELKITDKQLFRDNAIFAEFINENEGSSFNCQNLPEQIQRLGYGIELLNDEIRKLIAQNYETFLEQTEGVFKLEQPIEQLSEGVLQLNTQLNKLKQSLSTPYKEISQRMSLLARLQSTCDLLRKVIRILSLSKKLQPVQFSVGDCDWQQVSRDLCRQAQCISEANQLIQQDLAIEKVIIVKPHLDIFRKAQTQTQTRTEQLLEAALEKQDAVLITASLQVFYCFYTLEQQVVRLCDMKLQTLATRMGETFDFKCSPSRMWSQLEQLIEIIGISLAQMSLLARVLHKKRDFSNQFALIVQGNSLSQVDQFHLNVAELMLTRMQKCVQESLLLKDALEGEYPRLLRMFSDLNQRFAISGDVPLDRCFRKLLMPFESTFLSRSLSLLFDSVNLIFTDQKTNLLGSGDIQSLSRRDIDQFIRQMQNQLLVLQMDAELGRLVAKNVCKSINLLLVKSEQLVKVGAEATQVIGPATNSQKANALLVDRLRLFTQQLKITLASQSANADDEPIQMIRDQIKNVDSLMMNIIAPLKESILDSVEAIILTIHSENFTSQQNEQRSLYMKELQGFMIRINADYLSLYPKINVVEETVRQIATRIIDLFLLHCSIISLHGRSVPTLQQLHTRLANDFEQLEKCINSLCSDCITNLGRPYRVLRAFKPLLFQNAQEVSQSPAIGELIPYSLIIQFLISSYAPVELKLPHQNYGWSTNRFAKWFDEHPKEEDRLLAIKDSLECYVKLVIKKKDFTQFPEIYTIIKGLLEKGLNTKQV